MSTLTPRTLPDLKRAGLRCGLLLGGAAVLALASAATLAETAPLPSPPPEVEQYAGYNRHTRKLFDGTTLRKQWTAPELPGVPADRITAVAPAIRKDYKLTGETRPQVAAARSSPGAPVYDLDFGELPIGCYVIRVIALARSEDIEQYRKPLFLDFRVNDLPDGSTSRYRHRIPYWDDFHSVTEFYFNADQNRSYRGTLALGEGSLVDLYVHSIEFHDVLKGLDGRARKTRPGLFSAEERAMLRQHAKAEDVRASVLGQVLALDSAAPELTPAERRERDELLWKAFPPINSQFLGWFPLAFMQKDVYSPPSLNMAQVEQQHGTWESEGSWKEWFRPLVFVNRKLGLRHTRDDLEAHRPLPDPYPFKDDGGAVYLPRKEGMAHADNFSALGLPLRYRWTAMANPLAATDGDDVIHRLPYLYHALGDRQAARDAALLLCKWAHIYPTFTQAQVLDGSLISPGTLYGYDPRLTRRYVNEGLNGLQQGFAVSYDFLFDFIRGNQELAEAVGRFIPWVKSERDVRQLIEKRILQFGAKQVMRFHVFNDKETPLFLMRLAAVQQDPKVTRPWMEFLWKDAWIYPHPRAGLPDYLSTTTQRDGSTDIGSVFYTQTGSPFLELALMTRRYVLNGGDPAFDLSDTRRYRKVAEACGFPVQASVAGYPLSIGDVGGPAKPRLFAGFLPQLEMNFRAGVQLTGDPAMAWLAANYYGRRGESEAEWAAVTAAAGRQKGNPFLGQPSRVLPNWAGILETGQEAQDFRFVRAAVLRVGTGYGHTHHDTLDLQVIAHGVRAANDVGWRGGYSAPHPTFSQLHNLVEVDEANWQGHAWIPVLSAGPGSQYMMAVAVPPSNQQAVRSRTREVALIDVDAGQPGARPPAPLPYTDQTRFDPGAVTPNSYLFDVERVSGGAQHTYCFHGTVSDRFEVNSGDRGEVTEDGEKNYLRRFLQGPGMKTAGTVPEVLQATWRLRRTEETLNAVHYQGKPLTLKLTSGEAEMLGAAYDPASPAKHTRLHLATRAGDRALTGWFSPTENNPHGVTWPFLFVQRRGTDLESAYPAIIEPYAGEPFLTQVRPLAIPDNETDARRAVAVDVRTKNGRTDFCFSDGRPRPRKVGGMSVEGRFAYVSSDDKGLRMAHLVEGTRLATPWGTLTIGRSSHEGRVVRVDYWQRKAWLDGDWTDAKLVGAQVELGNPSHKTSFTVIAAAREGDLTSITLDKAIDLSFAHVVRSNPATRQLVVNIGPVGLENGMRDGLTCTADDPRKGWKCRIASSDPGSYSYELQGEFSAKDFPEGGVFRLWEFGVGDAARLVTHAVVARDANSRMVLESNTKATWIPPSNP